MTGKLYAIGVGPGDPELLTLKAVRILREVPCVCVPKGREEGSSLAMSIVQKALSLEGKEIIEAYFPMRKTRSQRTEDRIQSTIPPTQPSLLMGEGEGGGESLISNLCRLDEKWNETIGNVMHRLNKGIDVAFITLGDPTIYSTFFYLYDRLLELNPELNIEIIPGVSSITTAAAKAGMYLALADEKIAILPATYTESIKETLEQFDTIILMKVHRVFGNVVNILSETGLTDNAVYISQAGMDDEKIFKNIRDIKESDLNYFSLMIIKK